MPPLIEKYYRRWINSPTLFGPHDIEWFYRFVKASIRYGRCRRDGQWLRYFLEKDLPLKYPDTEYVEKQIKEAVTLFDHFIDYRSTSFPNDLLEMRDPYAVKLELLRIRNADESPKYSREQVESILAQNFGTDWETKWREKYGLLPDRHSLPKHHKKSENNL